MEIPLAQIALAVVTLIIAICIQTVAIGFFIGGIKSVVVRLVKDVEEIGSRISLAINDLVLAKRDIQEVAKIQGKHENKIEMLESKIVHIEEHMDAKIKRNYSQ
jgi:hypothetical protein